MKSIAISSSAADQKKKNFLYALPLAVTILTSTFYLKLPQGGHSATLAFLDNPNRLIILGFAYSAALALVCTKFHKSLLVVVNNKLFVLLSIYILVSVFWSKFPSKVIINWGHSCGLACVVISALFAIDDKPEKIFLLLSAYSFLAVITSLALCLFLPDRGIYSLNGRWMGVTTNPNSLGAICFVSIWANLACLGAYKQKKVQSFCALTILTTIVVLIGSNSITSTACCIFVIGCMLGFRMLRNNSPTLIFIKLFLVIAFSLSSMLVIYAIRPDLFTIDAIFSGVGRSKNLTGRTLLWEIGAGLLSSKPWFGWGFDSLASVFSSKSIETGQFHNGYIDLCIRGGFIGAGLVAMFVLKLILNCYAYINRNAHVASVYLILLFAILLHNISEASLLRSTHFLWILFLFSYFHTDCLNQSSTYPQKNDHEETQERDDPATQAASLSRGPV